MQNQQIRKAVIPVAGLGTRMLPATKAIPKEMLPVVDKPLIQYVVQEAIAAGIKEIVLVTHASKNSIENHFDTSFELEAQLERRVKRQLLEAVQAICPKDVTIISVRQSHAKGLGHAILCAKSVVGDNPFAVLLPDVLIDEHKSNLTQENLAEMVAKFDQTQASQIMVEGVPQDKVHLYGIADIDGASIEAGEFAKIHKMVEKPALEDAPSNLAVVGRYVLSKEIWNLLERTPVGAGDEIQLTDAIDMLIEEQEVDAYYMRGGSHDCGTKFGYVRATIEYALRHAETGDRVADLIQTLAKQEA
ncbi:UTP--glucose-1-phosphate uridylyltransferase GalU [Paraferrimonas sedimenticola]|uniref:UTP--glucose-1-phosphate uridylyltransferase n=1 Tax=Paraferrimonas sedimenticola TaxID=375674 RepID=A0AA37W147_9GAMM|nr:UTP--glucose-1-phosphate uridylyltransferase GalU [Paraferrimonas sedimenticola]GLP96940.1 UTP--glucose-1-phosphate uridylyltransferase [Paraferrimonas sedimenticola]